MVNNKSELLLEILRQREKELLRGVNVTEALHSAQDIKIGEEEFYNNRLARAVVLMAVGVNHEKLKFSKNKFYERVYSYCRNAVKVAVIVKKINAQ